MCVSVFSFPSPFYPALLSLFFEKNLSDRDQSCFGGRQRETRGGEGGRQEGGIMIERKEMEKGSGGCREPSCAKYLTLCTDLPKVRFVLGAYGFSHAGVLLSALPAVGILIKKGALLPPFPLSLPLQSSSSPFLFFPPSSLSTLFTTGTGMQHSRRE